MAILPDLSSLSREQLEQMVAALAAKPATKLTYKVGEKGNVCVYGPRPLSYQPVCLPVGTHHRRHRQPESLH